MDENKFLKIGVGSLAIAIAVYIVYLMIAPLVVSYYVMIMNRITDKVHEPNKKVYVLDGTAPVIDKCTTTEETLDVDAKSHVETFHYLFFTLAPDDKYIKHTMDKAMYLIDETGLAQYNVLKEKGFYNNIVSTSSVLSIFCDSINFDKEKMTFTYYGRQRIERRTNVLMRQLVTAGQLKRVPRTDNNPHGLIITNWRILQNYNLDRKQKDL